MEQIDPKLSFSIPVGRRVAEIMKEKGNAYTQQAMAKRLGISRETLRIMLTGERVILGFELRNIANDLRQPVERITQDDIKKEEVELRRLLVTLENNKKAIELAEKLAASAIGMTERGVSQNNLGRSYFICQRYDEAHVCWQESYTYALLVKEKFKDTALLFDVTTNLMISYTVRKEYSNLEKVLSELSGILHTNPERAGAICYSVAMIELQKNNKDAARKKLYESLDYYQTVGDTKSIGMAERNVAYIEYLTMNYLLAKNYFETAIPKLMNDSAILKWCHKRSF